jgi:uncharacterized protein (UPF0332 family)
VFDWHGYLGLADELAARSGDEAAARTAISRAYYAAFHAGRAYLNRVNIPAEVSGRAHRQLRQVLQSRDPAISETLARLHDWRKEADYDDSCSFDVERQASVAIELARTTIEKIESIRRPP